LRLWKRHSSFCISPAYAFINGLSSVPSAWPTVSWESPWMQRQEIPIPAAICRLASRASHSTVLLAQPSWGKASWMAYLRADL
jgi:hypothetical protein